MNPAILLALALAAGGAIALYQRSRIVRDAGAAAPGEALGGLWSAPDESPAAADPVAELVGGELPAVAEASRPVVDQLFGGEPVKTFSLPASAEPYKEAISQAEQKYGLPPGLLGRQLYQESRFRPEIIDGRVRSGVGATGIAQFMPATAREVGVDPRDPFASIQAAAAYMKKLFTLSGSWENALASYNWGIGNVLRKGLARAPAETKNYVAEISADVNLPT